MFKKKNNKETFAVPHNNIYPTRKGDLIFLFKQAKGTYHPFSNDDSNFILSPIHQNSLEWLSTKIVAIKEKYDEKKWWEPYIFPLSIVAVAIISLIMIVMTLDKVENINKVCSGVEQNLLEKIGQRIK